MTPEERARKEKELEQLRIVADAAHQAVVDKPDDEALIEAADIAEEACTALQAELDANPPAAAPKADGEEEDQDIDFEKELEALESGGQPPKKEDAAPRTELEKAERTLFFNAKRVKELGGDPKKVTEPLIADAPAPKAGDDVDPRYVTVDHLAEQEAAKLSQSDAQRKVILYHYNNSVKKTGNVIADIENAYFIANKGRIKRSMEEIRRSAYVRPSFGMGAGRKPAPRETRAPQLTSTEQSTLRRRGYVPKADGSWESKRYTMRYVSGKGWQTDKKQK